MTKKNSDECRIENSLNFLWEVREVMSFLLLLKHVCRSARSEQIENRKIEPQIRACVQSYELQMEMRKHFVHEHPEVSSSWEMLEVQSLINDTEQKHGKHFLIFS